MSRRSFFHVTGNPWLVLIVVGVSGACSSGGDDGAPVDGGAETGGVAGSATPSASGGAASSIGGALGGTGAIAGRSGLAGTGGGLSGATSGGTASGGATSGGTASGGATSGGAASGGATSGGAASGGAESGGTASGGATSGGTASGGATSGGTASGGAESGGATSGGAESGGDSSLCPPGIARTITVAKDGSGQYSSVQSAVDSISSGSTEHVRIDIKVGTYTEKLTIADRSNLCLVGADAASTVITYSDANATVGSTSGSASVLVSANDFSAANLTIQNSYGSGSQAVALRLTGERQQFLNCRFVGYQDTLYTHQGTQYFRDCYVQGNTDYVFGHATAVLQNCEVRNVEGGSAVAAPNTELTSTYGIVFLGGHFTANSSVQSNSVALGRPWGVDGAAAYLNVELDSHISAVGFVVMSGNDPAAARFHEYQSTGDGANASARPGYQLTQQQAAAYTLSNILPGWTPSYSQ